MFLLHKLSVGAGWPESSHSEEWSGKSQFNNAADRASVDGEDQSLLVRRIEALRLRHWLGSPAAKSTIMSILEESK